MLKNEIKRKSKRMLKKVETDDSMKEKALCVGVRRGEKHSCAGRWCGFHIGRARSNAG